MATLPRTPYIGPILPDQPRTLFSGGDSAPLESAPLTMTPTAIATAPVGFSLRRVAKATRPRDHRLSPRERKRSGGAIAPPPPVGARKILPDPGQSIPKTIMR